MTSRRIIVMGVSGAGKSTVGQALAARLGWAFADADDHHPATSRAKMERGEPLDEADRAPWLDRLATLLTEAREAGSGLVLACSALREAHRARLRAGDPDLVLVHLHGSREVLAQRLASRRGHFFPAHLLDSQLATLEEPADALRLPLDTSPEILAEEIVRHLGERSGGEA